MVKRVCLKKLSSSLLLALVLLGTSNISMAQAKVLQGSVESEGALRLQRPQDNQSGGTQNNDAALHAQTPMPAPDFRKRNLAGLIDTSGFHSPLSGNAAKDDVKLGLIKPADFGTIPNSKFDLGAERGDRELTLAWEAWHHQLSQAIYRRWSEIASVPGEATLKIVVTKDRQIFPELVKPSGNPFFDRGLMSAVRSLNGNPGLTFPTSSQRSEVSLEADYVAATDIQPGYSWVKNDYEHIHQSY